MFLLLEHTRRYPHLERQPDRSRLPLIIDNSKYKCYDIGVMKGVVRVGEQSRKKIEVTPDES